MSLIRGLLLYPGLLYPGLTLCCSIVQSTGNRKVAFISGFDCIPILQKKLEQQQHRLNELESGTDMQSQRKGLGHVGHGLK